MKDDMEAVEIGRLFRMAKEAGELASDAIVTDSRKSSGELSGSRNADPIPDPNKCFNCLAPFAVGQFRFPAHADVRLKPGFAFTNVVSSLCVDCFKSLYTDSFQCESLGCLPNGEPAPRYDRKCGGCCEPIHTLKNARDLCWSFCSNRCYQRDYRKRRRGRDSVVDWKGGRPHMNCVVCKNSLDTYGKPNKRKDAQFCSSKCRQMAYRRRKAQK
jgi:hypothetical protein